MVPATLDPIAVPLAGDVLQAMLDAYDDPAWAALSPCAAGLVAGAALVADHCCDQAATGAGAGGTSPCQGQLTVRINNVYPTENFPIALIGPVTAATSWAVELEIAVLRCALTVDTSTTPPTPPTLEQEMQVAETALADMGLIRHTMADFASDRNYGTGLAIGNYIPMGPDGGCVGGAVLVTLLVE